MNQNSKGHSQQDIGGLSAVLAPAVLLIVRIAQRAYIHGLGACLEKTRKLNALQNGGEDLRCVAPWAIAGELLYGRAH